MTQPIDYEPPKRGGKPPASVGMFLVGLLVGTVATVGLGTGGLVLANGATGQGSEFFAWTAITAAPVVVLIAGMLLIGTQHRSMGQGILTAVPLTVLAAFVLCGLALRNI